MDVARTSLRTKLDTRLADHMCEIIADAIDWKASTSLDLLDFVADGIVGADGPLGVDRLVRLLTDNTSALSLNLSGKVKPLVLPVPGVGNVSVALGDELSCECARDGE